MGKSRNWRNDADGESVFRGRGCKWKNRRHEAARAKRRNSSRFGGSEDLIDEWDTTDETPVQTEHDYYSSGPLSEYAKKRLSVIEDARRIENCAKDEPEAPAPVFEAIATVPQVHAEEEPKRHVSLPELPPPKPSTVNSVPQAVAVVKTPCNPVKNLIVRSKKADLKDRKPFDTISRVTELKPDRAPTEEDLKNAELASLFADLGVGKNRYWFKCKASGGEIYAGEVRGDSDEDVYNKLRALGIRAYGVMPWGVAEKNNKPTAFMVDPACVARKIMSGEKIVTV